MGFRVKQLTEEVAREVDNQSSLTSFVKDKRKRSELLRPRKSIIRLRGSTGERFNSEKKMS